MKRILLIMTLFLLCSTVCFAGRWAVHYSGPKYEMIQAKINEVNKKTDMIPVGISYYNGKVYLMFITDESLGAEAYWIQKLDKNLSKKKLQAAIQKNINKGWVPFDLTITPHRVIMLYLKCAIPIKAWRIMPSQKNWDAIQGVLNKNKQYFPLGFAFRGNEAYTLLINSPKAGVTSTIMKNCGASEKVIEKTINNMVKKGYSPYGFEYKGKQVGVVFVK